MQQSRKTTNWLLAFSRLTRSPTFATTALKKNNNKELINKINDDCGNEEDRFAMVVDIHCVDGNNTIVGHSWLQLAIYLENSATYSGIFRLTEEKLNAR